MPIIIYAESDPGARHAWRTLIVIEDARETIIDMVPALLGGWRFDAFRVVEAPSDIPCPYDALRLLAHRADSGVWAPLAPEAEPRVLAWLAEKGWTPAPKGKRTISDSTLAWLRAQPLWAPIVARAVQP